MSRDITYTIPSLNFVMASGYCGTRSFQCVRDSDTWESFSDENMEQYFRNAHKLFSERVSALGNLERSYTTKDEKELLFMADALSQARQTISNCRAQSTHKHTTGITE